MRIKQCKFSMVYCHYYNILSEYSGGTSVGKPVFWYTKLKLSGDHLYIIRNKFRPEAQNSDLQKMAYIINYSLKWLISLSREPFVL